VETTRTCVNNTSTAARNFLQPNVSARLEDMFNEKVTGELYRKCKNTKNAIFQVRFRSEFRYFATLK